MYAMPQSHIVSHTVAIKIPFSIYSRSPRAFDFYNG